MLCRQVAASRDGLNVCTLRLYSTYGPWEEPKRLVPALAVEGLRGTVSAARRPDDARDFVWVGRRRRCVSPRREDAAHASPGRSTTSAPGRRRRSARRPRSPATCSASTQRPAGARCRLGAGTPTAGSPTARRSATGSAGGPTRELQGGLHGARVVAARAAGRSLLLLARRGLTAWRTGPTSRPRTTEGWRPPLHAPPTTAVRRSLAALRRLIDLQAGSIWRDLAGELAEVEGLVLDVGCGAQPYRPLLGPSARYLGIDTADAQAPISDTRSRTRSISTATRGPSTPNPRTSFSAPRRSSTFSSRRSSSPRRTGRSVPAAGCS